MMLLLLVMMMMMMLMKMPRVWPTLYAELLTSLGRAVNIIARISELLLSLWKM